MPILTFQLFIQASKSIFSMFRTLSISMLPVWSVNFSKGLFKDLLKFLQMYCWLANWLQLLGALIDTLKNVQLGVNWEFPSKKIHSSCQKSIKLWGPFVSQSYSVSAFWKCYHQLFWWSSGHIGIPACFKSNSSISGMEYYFGGGTAWYFLWIIVQL